MSRARLEFGRFLEVLGIVFLALNCVAFIWFRFEYPKMTETELMIWTIERWWAWIPSFGLVGMGMWLVAEGKEK